MVGCLNLTPKWNTVNNVTYVKKIKKGLINKYVAEKSLFILTIVSIHFACYDILC